MMRHELQEPRHPAAGHARLHRQTLLKLDCLLLPFLALLFLFNALDKANIGNAESAHFTRDIGLAQSDMNTAVALFFAFFVTLQPLGAALGRRYGMVAWVPTCMLLWGVCTALHAWVRYKWQLFTLRILIGCFEAGFYPVTVTYLSLFYTRFEFGKRLSLFYGQAAVGGALGGLISYVVFSRFRDDPKAPDRQSTWRAWQVLFLLEGGLTIGVAITGYFWLPHSVDTAWFLSPAEREYATLRIVQDRDVQQQSRIPKDTENEEDMEHDEESRGLLSASATTAPNRHRMIVHDRGLSPHDIVASLLDTKIWHLLACNVLSAVPVYAFSVFMPLVLAPLMKEPNPSLINLMTAPPHFCGAITLFLFAHYSDKRQIRLKPILFGLIIVVTGLVLVVMLPVTWPISRYLALNVLLAGNYVASPLTVAWISGNTPSPGKRALLLGINGWGNLAGVVSAMLFRPKYAEAGYIVPFWWTLILVACAAVGYLLFLRRLQAENRVRHDIVQKWSEGDVQKENEEGRGPFLQTYPGLKRMCGMLKRSARLKWLAHWLEGAMEAGREGNERLTFVYGL
ncbi:hypothetical protein ACN47E_009028 [Coniothyrium glycines]